MSSKIPIDLIRLRNATRAYLSILRDVTPTLEAFAEQMKLPVELFEDGWA